jgi:manganese/iron transport system permease protein
MCPLLGSYAVTRGLGFMGDALAHAVLPGVVAAFLLGISPFIGAIPTAIGIALLIGYVSRRTGVSEDTSIGILFAGLFALGLALLSASSGIRVNLEDLLLGQVLGVSTGDVWVTGVLAAFVVAVLFAFHKELVFTSFDPVGAKVIGLPTRALDYLLLVLLALVIVIALQAVGIVLVIAMLITPAATAYVLVRRFVPAMALGALIGAVSAVLGLYLSYYLNLPSGPAMTLVSTAFFGITALTKRRFA